MPTYIDTIICEDIRPEVGNKVTLAGVFGEEIVLPVIPSALASLAIMQRWRVAEDELNRGVGNFSFAIESPDGHIDRVPIPQIAAPVRGIYVTIMSFVFKFMNFPIRLRGEYKVRTYLNGPEVSCYRFFVMSAADMQAAQAAQAAQARAIGFNRPQ
jgi:hypothetical protein